MRGLVPPVALALALAAAPTATAEEPTPAVVAYVAHYGGVACNVLDEFPSIPGMLGVMHGVETAGFSPREAGEVVGMSITEICPRHVRLMERFVDMYGGGPA